MSHQGYVYPVYETFFNAAETIADARKRLQYLKARHWIDASTKTIGIYITVYNGELSYFSELELWLEFERGGYIRSVFNVGSAPLHPYEAHPEMHVADGVFFLMLACLIVREGLDVWRLGMQEHLKNPWAQNSSMVIVLSLLLVVAWHGPVMEEVEDLAKHITDTDVIRFANNTTLINTVHLEKKVHEEIEIIQDRIAMVIMHIDWYRWGSAVNCFFILFQLFEVFVKHPHLSVILVTFAKAFNDIISFMFVFSFIFLTYAYTGHILYGHQLEDFASIEEAGVTCFLMLVGDGIDVYNEIKYMSPVIGFFWWFTFLVFGMLTMLQMLIAIIMDNYTYVQEAKDAKGKTIPVVTQILSAMNDTSRSCMKKKISSSDMYILIKYRILTDDTFGILRLNEATNKMERCICPKDLVKASKDWVYPSHTSRMNSALYGFFEGRKRGEVKKAQKAKLKRLNFMLKLRISPWKAAVAEKYNTRMARRFPSISEAEAVKFLTVIRSIYSIEQETYHF